MFHYRSTLTGDFDNDKLMVLRLILPQIMNGGEKGKGADKKNGVEIVGYSNNLRKVYHRLTVVEWNRRR